METEEKQITFAREQIKTNSIPTLRGTKNKKSEEWRKREGKEKYLFVEDKERRGKTK